MYRTSELPAIKMIIRLASNETCCVESFFEYPESCGALFGLPLKSAVLLSRKALLGEGLVILMLISSELIVLSTSDTNRV